MPRLHNSGVFYTRRIRDGFRKRYWACCIRCGKKIGPFTGKTGAWYNAYKMDLENTVFGYSGPGCSADPHSAQ